VSAASATGADPVRSGKRVLDPVTRVSEILFGLIMVLTFTGSLSVAEAGEEDVRVMLIGALGCNLAWGIIDGILYLMDSLAEKGRALLTFVAVRRAKDAAAARGLIASALPSVVAGVLEPRELDSLRERLLRLPEPPAKARLGREDWLGALGVALLVFASTFPVAIPFMVVEDAGRALRISNGIAVALLFVTGFIYGRVSGRNPWAVGISMVVLGTALVAMTIALGG
jgi:VIT1/CCC1 family predicted Fe2+/Mn2+ transporter